MADEDVVAELREGIRESTDLLARAIVGGINLERPTLRDYFAAHAPEIPGTVISQDPWVTWPRECHLQCLSAVERMVWWRFQFADTMLKAREAQ